MKNTDFNNTFQNPPSQYRGMPFWAWNTVLDSNELKKQIEIFKEMGYGGFYMHVRQGLETEYMGPEFMEAVKVCTQKAKEEKMYACLYDEDRWPSGCAGGMVTKEIRHRQKYLVMQSEDIADSTEDIDELLNESKSLFLGAFDIELTDDGIMTSYKKIDRNQDGVNKRYFFIIVKPAGEPRFNYQTYSDTMNKETVDKFIESTYIPFKENVGDEFGKTIPTIFTDEPQVVWNNVMDSSFSKDTIAKPWTHDFADTYENTYGEDILQKLPEIYFTMDGDNGKATRYNYYRHISERFCEAYMDNIGDWCARNGIMFTGHVIGEDCLYEIILNNADVMRTYKNMQLPGIDILCDDRAFTTPKQCQSVVHQYGKSGLLSELYGVTGWDFDFRGHKFQGDWQACLGVTHRVPHLAWQTMKGEGKRDYPASLSYQSPWYKEYNLMETHFARVVYAMTQGEPDVNVAVLHPIETLWMHITSQAESLDRCLELDAQFQDIAHWLMEGCIDYDYLAESLLDDLCADGTAPLKAGKMTYNTIIVSNCETLRPHTIKILKQFKESGGNLIFAGRTPHMCLAKEDIAAKELTQDATVINHSKYELLDTLKGVRSVKIQNENLIATDNLMHSMRKDGENKWLFIAHTKTPQLHHISAKQNIIITVKGNFVPTLYDTFTGDTSTPDYSCNGNTTEIRCSIYDFDSLLIKLEKSDSVSSYKAEKPEEYTQEIMLNPKCSYKLSEPNVLVLDMPEYSLDGEEYNSAEEILRIDEIVRKRLGLDLRRTKVVQPYCIKNVPEDHTLRLRYTIENTTDLSEAMLGMENARKAAIVLNGVQIPSEVCSSYVDDHIDVVALPGLNKGENILEITMPFGQRTDLENCFLLGDFGTTYAGRFACVTQKPENLYFGNAVTQGMAFYGGNIEYNSSFTTDCEGKVQIEVSHYRGALVRVYIDGKDAGHIALSPFRVTSDNLAPGKHHIKFVLYGNRYNTFNAMHSLLADKTRIYMGPDYWRSDNDGWAYEYQTRPFGILKTPVIKFSKK